MWVHTWIPNWLLVSGVPSTIETNETNYFSLFPFFFLFKKIQFLINLVKHPLVLSVPQHIYIVFLYIHIQYTQTTSSYLSLFLSFPFLFPCSVLTLNVFSLLFVSLVKLEPLAKLAYLLLTSLFVTRMPESMSISVNGQSQVPPGFRFHPTEEELLQYYLRKKVSYEKIDLDVIRDVDLNKLEPWDIQGNTITNIIPR